jgi:phytoene desaturase
MVEENIKIIKDAEVTEILTENKKVTGVKINNSKIINSDYVICNSDPPNVYNNLIKSKEDYDFLFKQKMKRMDYSMGLFVYYFGSKKNIAMLRITQFILGKLMKNTLIKFLKRRCYLMI